MKVDGKIAGTSGGHCHPVASLEHIVDEIVVDPIAKVCLFVMLLRLAAKSNSIFCSDSIQRCTCRWI